MERKRRPVQEVSTSLGQTIHQSQVGRDKGDSLNHVEVLSQSPRTLAIKSRFLPRRVNLEDAVSGQILRRQPTSNRCLAGTFTDEISILSPPEALERREQVDGLKKIRLALGVVAPKDTDPRRRIQINRPEVTKVSKGEARDLQCTNPLGKADYSSRMGMIT